MRLTPVFLMAMLLAGCLQSNAPEPAPATTNLELVCDPCQQRISTGGALFEPHVLADPDDADRIVAYTGDGGGPTFYSTTDGKSWTRTTYPIGPGSQDPEAATWVGWGDPALAYRHGDLVAVALGNSGAGAAGEAVLIERDVWLAHGDGPDSLGAAVIVTSTERPQSLATGRDLPFATPDREFIAVAPDGEAMVTWVLIQGEGGSYWYDLQMSRSTDLETWSTPQTLLSGRSPKGPYPFHTDRFQVAYSTFQEDGLYVIDERDDWAETRLGAGIAAPAVAVAEHAAIATISAEGPVHPVVYIDSDEEWVGPIVAGRPDGAARHVSVAWVGDEVWVGWYDVGDSIAYKVGRIRDGALIDTIVVEDGLAGDIGRYGDYVYGMNGRDDGADIVYVAGDDDGRWLHHSRYTWSASA